MTHTLTMHAHGPTVSRIIPGLMRLMEWNLDAPGLLNWIEAVLDMGITSFDHADIYGPYRSEEHFGAALALKPALRQKMQLITKCGIKLMADNRPQHTVHSYDTSRAHILASVEQSLRNLHTDYIDVLLIHRSDPLMDADEVAAAFTTLKSQGKVRYFGVSNFLPWHFDLLQSRLDMPLVTNQVELSVLHLDALHDGSLDQAQRHRIAPMIWSPLGGGALFREDGGERAARVRGVLAELNEELGADGIDQVALAWAMKPPANPLPVLGTGRLERIRSANAAVDLAERMSRDQWFRVWEASAGHEVP